MANSEGESRSKRDTGSGPERKEQDSQTAREERREDRPRKSTGGFKWKEKRRDNEDDGRPYRETSYRNSRESRNYRDRSKSRSRSRSPRRHPDRTRSPKSSDRDRRSDNPPRKQDGADVRDAKRSRDTSEKKEKKPPAPAAPQQPMIIVYVNDRLGTKKAIPCFATDPIKDFKVIVASMIGRKPHEILLKRQGERPFKDQLTLQDYGVSNNVQLDLEVDTGD